MTDDLRADARDRAGGRCAAGVAWRVAGGEVATMSETPERKAELDARRRGIAATQGYKAMPVSGAGNEGKWHIVKDDKQAQFCGLTPDEAWDIALSHCEGWFNIPDWPRDAGAALALCRRITRRKHMTTEITLYSDGGMAVNGCEYDIRDGAPEDATAAEILSRWALAALKDRNDDAR